MCDKLYLSDFTKPKGYVSLHKVRKRMIIGAAPYTQIFGNSLQNQFEQMTRHSIYLDTGC